MPADRLAQLARQIPEVIGEAFVRDHIEDVDKSFETASWSRTTRSHVGAFPLLRSIGYNGELSFAVKLPAICTSSFFPSSFGGCFVGKGGVDEEVGRLFSFRRVFDPTTVPQYYEQWAHSSTDQLVIRVSPLAVPSILAYGRAAVDWHMEMLTDYHASLDSTDPKVYPREPLERLGMVRHCAEYLANWARMCERLPRHADWFAERVPEHPAEAAWQIPTS